MLINLARDSFRRERRRRQHLAGDSVSLPASPDPADDVWRAVRVLPRLQRAVIALYYANELSIGEIAEVMGVTAGSVKTSIFRARESLAQRLKEDSK